MFIVKTLTFYKKKVFEKWNIIYLLGKRNLSWYVFICGLPILLLFLWAPKKCIIFSLVLGWNQNE